MGKIFAVVDLQCTPICIPKFQVNWPRGVGGVVISKLLTLHDG